MSRRFWQLLKVFGAILAGIAFGFLAPERAIGFTNGFQALFKGFVQFLLPFIVFGFVTSSIANAERGAGRTLALTVGMASLSTVSAGFFAYGVIRAALPFLRNVPVEMVAKAVRIPELFQVRFPAMMNVTVVLAISVFLGVAISLTKAEKPRRAVYVFRNVVMQVVSCVIVPILPVYVFSVMADLASSGRLSVAVGGCARIMALACFTTVAILLLLYVVVGLVVKKNPLSALVRMLPAYLAGCGSCSSVASIPYTLRQTKLNGVSDTSAELVIPLGSSIQHSGSVANIVIFTAGLIALTGGSLSFQTFAPYILLVSVVSLASPGMPGGVALATASVARVALGFPAELYDVVVAIYLVLDGVGTACNLTCDGAIAMMVDKFVGHRTAVNCQA